jgi:two-component system, sensor histidine kinase YesM
MKIATRLSLSFGVLSLVLVGLLGLTMYQSSKAIIRRSIAIHSFAILSQVGDAVSFQLGVLERLVNLVLLDPVVERLAAGPAQLEDQVRLIRTAVVPAMQRAMMIPDRPIRVQLYLDVGALPEIYYDDWAPDDARSNPLTRGRLAEVMRFDRVRGFDWAIARPGPRGGSRLSFVGADENFANVSLVEPIIDQYRGEQHGVLRIQVALADVFAAVDTSAIGHGVTLIVHDTDRPIYQLPEMIVPTADLVGIAGSAGITDTDAMRFYHDVASAGWRFELIVPRAVLGASAGPFATTIAVSVAIVVLLFVVSGIALSRGVGDRISTIVTPITAFRHGDLDARSAAHENDELQVVESAFNDMADEIRTLIDRNEQVYLEKQRAELGLLHARINPHFLFNVLSSTSKLVWLNRRDQAYEMILKLAQFYRRTLSDTAPTVPVSVEVAQAESYIELTRLIYGDSLTVTTDFTNDALDCATLHFIVQPFLENALAHAWCRDQLHVTIAGHVRDTTLEFSVADDGVGMSAEQCSDLLAAGATTERYGIRNVHERVVLQYGDGFGVQISSCLGRGTTVTVRQPAIDAASIPVGDPEVT